MAASSTKPSWNVSSYVNGRNASTSVAIAANLLLVPDSSADRCVKVPATSATITNFSGVAFESIAASGEGNLVRRSGDVAVVKASGTIVKGDRIIIDTASGKEGWGLAWTSGTKVMVGYALTAAADGELFEMSIQFSSITA